MIHRTQLESWTQMILDKLWQVINDIVDILLSLKTFKFYRLYLSNVEGKLLVLFLYVIGHNNHFDPLELDINVGELCEDIVFFILLSLIELF